MLSNDDIIEYLKKTDHKLGFGNTTHRCCWSTGNMRWYLTKASTGSRQHYILGSDISSLTISGNIYSSEGQIIFEADYTQEELNNLYKWGSAWETLEETLKVIKVTLQAKNFGGTDILEF